MIKRCVVLFCGKLCNCFFMYVYSVFFVFKLMNVFVIVLIVCVMLVLVNVVAVLLKRFNFNARFVRVVYMNCCCKLDLYVVIVWL